MSILFLSKLSARLTGNPTPVSQLLKNHHYLLSTLVLWNAASMEALPIFLDKLADPVTAVILSVTVVLIFGMKSFCTSGV